MAKKKIDDYIQKHQKIHEDEEHIKKMTFSTVSGISVKKSMPVYDISDENGDETESKDQKSSEEE